MTTDLRKTHGREINSEFWHRQLIATSYEGIWVVNDVGITTYVNQRLATMLGFTREEMIGKPFFEFVIEEQREEARKNLEDRRYGKVAQLERCLIRKDNECIWTIVSVSPILNNQEQFEGVLAMVTDISEIKKSQDALNETLEKLERRVEERTQELSETNEALLSRIRLHLETEKRLKETQERFDFVTRATNDIVFDWDIPSDTVWYNEAIVAILGHSGGTFGNARETWLQRMHAQDRVWIEKKFKAFLEAKEQIWSAQYRIHRYDGNYASILDHAFLVYDEQGSPLRFVGTTSDVSVRVRVEEERKNLLRSVVEAHDEERKHLARELHDQLSQQFITLDIGLAALKDSQNLSAETIEQICSLQNLVAELGKETRRIEFDLHPAPLEEATLQEAITDYAVKWSEQTGLPLKSDFDVIEDEISLSVKTCLYRVVQEAMTNIYKHAGASLVCISIKHRDREIILIVEDDGHGFDSNKYQRGKRSGLGLRSMRERVELLGGYFEVESSPGSGTSVFAHVPLEQGKESGHGTTEDTISG